MEDKTPTALSTALTLPDHVTSLATSGVIITIRQTCMTFTMQDSHLSKKVSDDGNAKTLAGGWSHDLFGKGKDKEPTLRALLNHRQTVYNFANANLFVWGKGEYYCPTATLPKVIKQFDDLKRQHADLKSAWGEAYDAAIARQAFLRGDYFNRNHYMPRDEMLKHYNLSMVVREVPVGDFRNAISADIAQDLLVSLSQQHERRIAFIAKQQSERMVEVLESLSHCCELVQERDKDGNLVTKRRKLYTSTIDKALQLCDLFEEFNLGANPALEKARAGLAAALDGIDVDALKESDTLRTVIKEQVDDVLALFRPTLVTDDASVWDEE